MGPGTEHGVAARRPHARRRRGHVLRRRLQPADPSTVARRCGSRSTSRPTKRAWPPPTRTAARRCSRPARATCRRSPTGTPSSATAACPRSASTPTDGSLLFDAHLPFDMSFYRAFRFPWSGRPLTPARGARQPQQHRRRDDRARELERRDGRRLLARARRASTAVARGADHDRGERLRELDDPAGESTPTSRCRRSTPPATCSRTSPDGRA